MKTILSTKKLKPNQRDLLLGAGFRLVDYNAIQVSFLDFPLSSQVKNAIFTSQNGVYAIMEKLSRMLFSEIEMLQMQVFCVGEKTKALLESHRFDVVEVAKNAEELAQTIIKNYTYETFHFLCGAMRRNELPEMLQSEGIKLEEIITYTTELQPKQFEQNWDGILFFSPSGVESYFTLNNKQNEKCICIGNTTGQAAKKYNDDVVIANATTVESVIAKAVKILKN